jgi:hypothetical protein
VLQNVGLFEGSTVGPQKNPKVLFPGQKSGAAGIFLFRPKWTNGARADFLAYSGGFFLSLAKNGSKFGKISENPKNVGQKNEKNSKPVPLHTSFAHQSSCNICFLQEYFFSWESWEKYFLAPRLPPATPSYPGFRVTKCWPLRGVNRWSSEKSKGAFPRPEIGSRRFFFISTKMDQRCSGGFLGPLWGVFLSLAKIGSKFGKVSKNPKNVGQKKI